MVDNDTEAKLRWSQGTVLSHLVQYNYVFKPEKTVMTGGRGHKKIQCQEKTLPLATASDVVKIKLEVANSIEQQEPPLALADIWHWLNSLEYLVSTSHTRAKVLRSESNHIIITKSRKVSCYYVHVCMYLYVHIYLNPRVKDEF